MGALDASLGMKAQLALGRSWPLASHLPGAPASGLTEKNTSTAQVLGILFQVRLELGHGFSDICTDQTFLSTLDFVTMTTVQNIKSSQPLVTDNHILWIMGVMFNQQSFHFADQFAPSGFTRETIFRCLPWKPGAPGPPERKWTRGSGAGFGAGSELRSEPWVPGRSRGRFRITGSGKVPG